MTTKEKIEVMQAYERGEEIEIKENGKEDWSEAKFPLWVWDKFEYRVKPKFKDGDEVVRKSFADCSSPADIWHVGSIAMEGMNLGDFIKADDVLWYWEYQDEAGDWHMLDRRCSKEGLNMLEFHEQASAKPLYALGFRLPREKDEEWTKLIKN